MNKEYQKGKLKLANFTTKDSDVNSITGFQNFSEEQKSMIFTKEKYPE
jgi:hypothetical protein